MTVPLTLHSRSALARLARHGGKPDSKHSEDVKTSHFPSSTSSYNHLIPLSRRAAVLVLLFKEARTGNLRVVVTMRGAGMRAYASQAALPGGHADSIDETPIVTARREAFEEIGLPLPRNPYPQKSSPLSGRAPAQLPHSLTITHLCELPTYLAKTALSVKPCIAFLGTHEDVSSFMQQETSSPDAFPSPALPQTKTDAKSIPETDIETLLTPQLDATEVAAVFSAPLSGFLHSSHPPPDTSSTSSPQQTQTPWYKATPFNWHTTRKIMHTFTIPTANQRVHLPPASPSPSSSSSSSQSLHADKPPSHYPIHGLTAQILIDTARLAYDMAPDFQHLESFGDEALIGRLLDDGRGKFARDREKGEEFTDEVGEGVHNWLEDVYRGQENSRRTRVGSKDQKL